MEAKELFDKIISLCYDIDNPILSKAVYPIEEEEGEAHELVPLLDEIMLLLNDIIGDDGYTDELIRKIERLYAELYEM